jgi:hypothetical protein
LVLARDPKRVRSLTLTNCEVHDNYPPAALESVHRMAQEGSLADALSALARNPGLARTALASAFEHAEDLSDEIVMGYFEPFASPGKALAVQRYIAGMESSVTVAIRDELARFLGPTLIVWGCADEYFDVSWAHWLATTIPGTVRCVEVNGAKLFFPAERPDVLNRELRELWTKAEMHALVNQYCDAWNSHDLDAVMSMHSEGTTFTQRTGPIEHTGSEAVRQAFQSDLAQWADAHWEPMRRIISGDVCVLESTLTATAAAPLDALGFNVPQGAVVRGRCVDVLVAAAGRVSQKDTYLDVVEVLASAHL